MTKAQLRRAGSRVAIFLLFAGGFTQPLLAQTEDITPPRLLTFSFSPTSVDTTSGPQSVVVTYTATDDLAGVAASGALNFEGPSGQIVQGSGVEIGRSGSPEVVTFQGTAVFPQFSEAGTWRIRFVPLSDRAANFTSVDLAAQGFPTDLMVTSTSDTLAPQLLTFGFSPTSVDTTSGPQSVVATYTATDDLSGVAASGALNFEGPAGQIVQGSGVEIGRSGSPEIVTFQGTAVFPQFSETGIWRIRFIPLSDRAANFTSVDLAAQGFRTDLMVTSTSDMVVPQLLTFSFSPTNIDTTRSPQNVVVTYTATDNFSGVAASGALNFEGPSGQIVQGSGVEIGRSGSPEVVTFQGTATFPQFSQCGTWRIRFIPLSDRAANFTSVSLEALGFPTDVRNCDTATTVTIDVKPGSFPNSLNPKARGVIPVAILTTPTFDARSVNVSTVRFGPNSAAEAHTRAHYEDVDGDGDTDLVLHFRVADTGIQCGDTQALLIGETLTGVAIRGTDSIRTVGCK